MFQVTAISTNSDGDNYMLEAKRARIRREQDKVEVPRLPRQSKTAYLNPVRFGRDLGG